MTDKKNPAGEEDKILETQKADDGHTLTYHKKNGDEPPSPLLDEAKAAETESKDAAESPAEKESEIKTQAEALPSSEAVDDLRKAGFLNQEEEEEPAEGQKSEKSSRKKAKDKRSGAENLAVVARFRWMVLLALSLAAVIGWTLEAVLSERPYHLLAWGLLAATLILSLGTIKLLRRPTRAGLAALAWAGTCFISAVYGPPDSLYPGIPAALIWSGLLSLIMIWTGVAIWRKLGRYKVIDVILSLFVIYAALSPIFSLIDNIMGGSALNLSFSVLAASPEPLTSHLPWFLWPMSVTIFMVLPLAALFSLGDQITVLKRRGARHGGNFFLALAFICLLPYGFMVHGSATKDLPELAEGISSLKPSVASIFNSGDAPAPASQDAPQAAPQTPAAVPAPPAATEEEPPLAVDASDDMPPVRPTSPPIISVTPPSRPDLEDRLAEAEQKLILALERIEELEKQLEKLSAAPAEEKTPEPTEKTDEEAAGSEEAVTLNTAPDKIDETEAAAEAIDSAEAPEVLIIIEEEQSAAIEINEPATLAEATTEPGESLTAAAAEQPVETLTAEAAAVTPPRPSLPETTSAPRIGGSSSIATPIPISPPLDSEVYASPPPPLFLHV